MLVRTVRIANPEKRGRAKAKARRNPIFGPIGGVLGVMSNGKKKAKEKARKANPAVVYKARKRNGTKSHRRRNPGFALSRSRRSYRRAKNPQFAGMSLIGIAKLGAGGLVGGIGTRGITQLVLRDKNTGAPGILGNLVAGGLLTWGASKMDATLASGVAAGAVAAIAQRLWDVYGMKVLPDGTGVSAVAPAQATAAQTNTPSLGDVSFSANGLGFYSKATWPLPQLQNGFDNPAATAAAPAPATFAKVYNPPFTFTAA